MKKRTIDSLNFDDISNMKNDLVMRGIIEDFLNKGEYDTAENIQDDWTVKGTYFIDANWFDIMDCTETDNFKTLSSYNIFESDSEAYKWAKKINAMNKLRLIANHLNGDWIPDWYDYTEKYFISFDPEYEKYIVDCCSNIIYNVIAFKDDDSATKALNLMGQESLDDLFA